MNPLAFNMWIFPLVAVLLFSCERATAGWAQAVIPSVTKTASGSVVKGNSLVVSNGAFITPATVAVAGRSVTMPATVTFVADAASFAVARGRGSPLGMGLALASFFASEGLQYIDGEWKKTVQTGGGPLNIGWSYQISTNGGSIYGPDPDALARSYCASRGWTSGAHTCTAVAPMFGGAFTVKHCQTGYSCEYPGTIYKDATCYAGYTLTNGVCIATSYAPAQQANFDSLSSRPLPDAVAVELAASPAGFPVRPPVLNPAPVKQPLSDPYLDPKTGKTIQPQIIITPSPTADDPLRVRVDSVTQEIAPAAEPSPGDPVYVPESEKPTDPCLENPNRVGCLDAGEPEEADLEKQNVSFSVTPVSVGGAGSCPPDKVFGAGGRFSFSYKAICDGASMIKPVVIVIAWLLAAYIIAGVRTDQ